jgi:short subunit dehydrogenase-like uncharacterized protein
MLYGANGYTGDLIAREAVSRGIRPILAGRDGPAVEGLGRELQCPTRVFRLDAVDTVAAQLGDVRALLNCAGPFSATAELLMDACLHSTTNYLDITGEIDVIEAAASRSSAAVSVGVALLPAVGFDVVPSDCLAAMLAERLPGASHLQLAISSTGPLSPGTAKTVVETLPSGGRARINGRIERVPLAWKVMQIRFREGTRWAMTIPWGDVASAIHSTSIPNIEVYAAMPRHQIRWIKRLRLLMPALKFRLLRSWINYRIERGTQGPSAAERSSGRTSLWGRATAPDGTCAEATLVTPDGYQLTAMTAVTCVERLLASAHLRGFLTPSKAFGSRFITEFPGCEVHFVN